MIYAMLIILICELWFTPHSALQGASVLLQLTHTLESKQRVTGITFKATLSTC